MISNYFVIVLIVYQSIVHASDLTPLNNIELAGLKRVVIFEFLTANFSNFFKFSFGYKYLSYYLSTHLALLNIFDAINCPEFSAHCPRLARGEICPPSADVQPCNNNYQRIGIECINGSVTQLYFHSKCGQRSLSGALPGQHLAKLSNLVGSTHFCSLYDSLFFRRNLASLMHFL